MEIVLRELSVPPSLADRAIATLGSKLGVCCSPEKTPFLKYLVSSSE